jgi:cellulose synthase/poly-beta-1,6-N-acetylglucosamine synthase-like glycosyltransferase
LIIEFLEAQFLISTALMIVYLVRHYVFTIVVLNNTYKDKKTGVRRKATYEPIVSILIPARNEEQVIGRILQRMTELTYSKNKMQIIVIDDASMDNTGKIVEEYAKNYGYIKVIHRVPKEWGKVKASALNAGLKYAKGDIIICFDADYYPQVDIIEKLVTEFVDPKVGGVQGRVTVLNEPRNIVTRLVALERVGGYRIDQQARDTLGLIPQLGGTAVAIRRKLLESLDGWDESILAEDTDLTFRVCLAGYKIRYVNDVECYEEAVENWRAYWKQRCRWAKGHMQCAFKHSLKVLNSNNLLLKEKIDGLLLLNVYFMPILVWISWIISVLLFFSGLPQWFNALLTSLPIFFYSFVGNFAPFFEVGIGAYLDGRTRACWLIPLLILTFLYNIVICTKAFTDLLISKIFGKRIITWDKTLHSGSGNSYIMK